VAYALVGEQHIHCITKISAKTPEKSLPYLPCGVSLNTCPVKFQKNNWYGFIGVSWKWSCAYLTEVGSANYTGIENC
jgi:hypothetical protein